MFRFLSLLVVLGVVGGFLSPSVFATTSAYEAKFLASVPADYAVTWRDVTKIPNLIARFPTAKLQNLSNIFTSKEKSKAAFFPISIPGKNNEEKINVLFDMFAGYVYVKNYVMAQKILLSIHELGGGARLKELILHINHLILNAKGFLDKNPPAVTVPNGENAVGATTPVDVLFMKQRIHFLESLAAELLVFRSTIPNFYITAVNDSAGYVQEVASRSFGYWGALGYYGKIVSGLFRRVGVEHFSPARISDKDQILVITDLLSRMIQIFQMMFDNESSIALADASNQLKEVFLEKKTTANEKEAAIFHTVLTLLKVLISNPSEGRFSMQLQNSVKELHAEADLWIKTPGVQEILTKFHLDTMDVIESEINLYFLNNQLAKMEIERERDEALWPRIVRAATVEETNIRFFELLNWYSKMYKAISVHCETNCNSTPLMDLHMSFLEKAMRLRKYLNFDLYKKWLQNPKQQMYSVAKVEPAYISHFLSELGFTAEKHEMDSGQDLHEQFRAITEDVICNVWLETP